MWCTCTSRFFGVKGVMARLVKVFRALPLWKKAGWVLVLGVPTYLCGVYVAVPFGCFTFLGTSWCSTLRRRSVNSYGPGYTNAWVSVSDECAIIVPMEDENRDVTDSITNPRHHAYIIFGGISDEELRRCGGKHMHIFRRETPLTVDEVRLLHEYASQSVGTDTRKVLLEIPGMTFQAQNALLKLIEEMHHGVYFYLCIPPGTKVLDTLLSRCYSIEAGNGGELSERFEIFIVAKPAERLKMIDRIWEEGETVRHATLLRLLRDLETYLHRCIAIKDRKSPEHIRRCGEAADLMRVAIRDGALGKITVQTLAFV